MSVVYSQARVNGFVPVSAKDTGGVNKVPADAGSNVAVIQQLHLRINLGLPVLRFFFRQ